jgi:FixJ family two-component response regulator
VLTEREREIVALVATGMSNAEIADHLTLSTPPGTSRRPAPRGKRRS